jgi:hypothetical protein
MGTPEKVANHFLQSVVSYYTYFLPNEDTNSEHDDFFKSEWELVIPALKIICQQQSPERKQAILSAILIKNVGFWCEADAEIMAAKIASEYFGV